MTKLNSNTRPALMNTWVIAAHVYQGLSMREAKRKSKAFDKVAFKDLQGAVRESMLNMMQEKRK